MECRTFEEGDMPRKICLAVFMLVIWVPLAQGKVYRWVDAEGKVHFSDRPANPAAEEMTYFDNASDPLKTGPENLYESPPPRRQKAVKSISAEDYEILARLEQKNDYVYLSGRISAGPPCKILLLDVYGQNPAGITVHITDRAENLGGFMSDLLEGKRRLKGPVTVERWEITSIRARCVAEH